MSVGLRRNNSEKQKKTFREIRAKLIQHGPDTTRTAETQGVETSRFSQTKVLTMVQNIKLYFSEPDLINPNPKPWCWLWLGPDG